jgi:hypothetical protein
MAVVGFFSVLFFGACLSIAGFGFLLIAIMFPDADKSQRRFAFIAGVMLAFIGCGFFYYAWVNSPFSIVMAQ